MTSITLLEDFTEPTLSEGNMQCNLAVPSKGFYKIWHAENEIFMESTLKNSSNSKWMDFSLSNQHYKKLYALNYTQQLQFFPPGFYQSIFHPRLHHSISIFLSLSDTLVSLLSQCWTGWKFNASAEKHTSGNDLSASAARVMNSANCAYHRLLLLVLIAAAASRLEKGWALLPRARQRQVILICDLFMCHSEGKATWEMSDRSLE